MIAIIKYLLKIYRKTSGLVVPPSCRYYPSCSNYYEEAIEKHGIVNGSILGIRRLIKCNQFFKGGFDPVP